MSLPRSLFQSPCSCRKSPPLSEPLATYNFFWRDFLATSSSAGDPTFRIISPRSTCWKRPRYQTTIHALARVCSSIGDSHHAPVRGQLHFSLSFVSESCTFLDFLDFSDTQRHLQDFGSCFAPSSSCVSSLRSLIVVVS